MQIVDESDGVDEGFVEADGVKDGLSDSVGTIDTKQNIRKSNKKSKPNKLITYQTAAKLPTQCIQ